MSVAQLTHGAVKILPRWRHDLLVRGEVMRMEDLQLCCNVEIPKLKREAKSEVEELKKKNN